MSNSNDPASPVFAQQAGTYEAIQHLGLTKRELFAIKILQGALAHPSHDYCPLNPDNRAASVKDAVVIADALIAELNKETL